MGVRNPRVDEYIAKAPDFAKPILVQVREVVHSACPDVEETIKWRMPSFEWKGMLAGMAAFKQHAVLGFWKHKLIVGDDAKAKEAMGCFGCLKSLKDLPSKSVLAKYVKTAMKLNEAGVKVVRSKTRPKKAVGLHADFTKALTKNAKARATLDGFPPSARAEYVEWIADAKQEATRARRIADAVLWLSQGKRRHWKYANC